TLPTARPTQVPVALPTSRPVVVATRPVYTRPTPVRPATPVVTSPLASSSGTYTVAPHETLYALARRVGVRPTELAAWNSLSPTAALQVGQVLRLSAPAAPAAAPSEAYYAHTVAVGDTFFNISRRYGCSVAELQASNGRPEPTLRVGETLRVPIH
ncbi:MAG: LysM peptidoglycan-binding domain-containing protein, partial [Hymenobacter sp.]